MCKCLEALAEWRNLPDQKGLFRFVDMAYILNLGTGDGQNRPVLRSQKEGKDGRLNVGRPYYPVKFCPHCGAKVEAWAHLKTGPEQQVSVEELKAL